MRLQLRLRSTLEPAGLPTVHGSLVRALLAGSPCAVLGLLFAAVPGLPAPASLPLGVLVAGIGFWLSLSDDLQRRGQYLLQLALVPLLSAGCYAFWAQWRALREGWSGLESQAAALTVGALLAPLALHLGSELRRLGFPAWLHAPAFGFSFASCLAYLSLSHGEEFRPSQLVFCALFGAALAGPLYLGERLERALLGLHRLRRPQLAQSFENFAVLLVFTPLLGWLSSAPSTPIFLVLVHCLLLYGLHKAWLQRGVPRPPAEVEPTQPASEPRTQPAAACEVLRLADLRGREGQRETPYHHRVVALAARLGAEKLGFKIQEVYPGSYSCPYHYHTMEEELFLVLEGAVQLRQGGMQRRLESGDLVFFPCGPTGAHQFHNQGDKPCRLLCISNRDPNEVCVYPDSAKVYVDRLAVCFPAAAAVPFLEGELDPRALWPQPQPAETQSEAAAEKAVADPERNDDGQP